MAPCNKGLSMDFVDLEFSMQQGSLRPSLLVNRRYNSIRQVGTPSMSREVGEVPRPAGSARGNKGVSVTMADSPPLEISPAVLRNLNKGRKRECNPAKWERNKRKRCRNAGEPYKTARNLFKPGKLPPTEDEISCNGLCKFNCGDLSFSDKLTFFKDFYNLTYNGQSNFLVSACMKIKEIEQRTVDEATSRRTCSVLYFIPVVDKDVRVCQKTLCNILKISPKRLRVLQNKVKFGESLTDKRGSHKNRPNKVTNDVIDLVKAHIASFPMQENHYSRNESSKRCLDPALSRTKMWSLFKAKHPNVNCSQSFYRDIFNKHFNLRFGLPRSDCCAFCDRIFMKMKSTQDESVLKSLEEESTLHHIRADAAYKSLSADSELSKVSNNVIVLCVDLQQVLFCPKLNHSNVFYQRQLSCYNLAVHNMGRNCATMFFWDETIAKRGSLEVTSCIMKYVQDNFVDLQPGETRKLVLWSDRCIGQNNNWRMVTLLHHLVVKNFFSSAEQKFLTTGHSFLPCDRDFALIERQKKSAKVYTPRDWVSVIANSSSKFLVCCMNRNDFKDLSPIENSLNKGSFKVTESVWLQITGDDPTTLRGRPSHNILQPWTNHSLGRRAPGRGNNILPPLNLDELPAVYSGPLPIKTAKKKDLMDMMQYIPHQYHDFYLNISAQ